MTRACRAASSHTRGLHFRPTIEALEDRRMMSVAAGGSESPLDVEGSSVSAGPLEAIAPAAESATSTVTGRHVFYNGSKYDNHTPGIDPADSAAIATDKIAYLPGAGVITSASTTSYTRGINGVFVDLTGQHGTLSLADFEFAMSEQGLLAANEPETWVAAPAPIGFSVLSDMPLAGTDRVEFIWADGAIENRYLEVTVKGDDQAGAFNTNTGLGASDIFYFGNQVGDTFVDTGPTVFTVTAADETEIQAQIISTATITSKWDLDRNGVHLASDRIIARRNTISVLNRINILSAGSVYLMHADGSGTFFPAAADTDLARGSALRAAATTAVAGETVLLGPGTFNIDAGAAAIFVAAGISIKGAGMDVTTIESGMTDAVINKAILVLNDNVTLEDFTFHGTAVNAYQRPIGSDSAYSIHDAVLRRVKIYAPNASDALYDWALSTSSYYLYDCHFVSGFSVVRMLASGGEDFVYAENCIFEVHGENYDGPEDGWAIAAFNKRGTQHFKDSQFIVTNDGFRTAAAMVWGQYEGVTVLENTTFDVSATSGAVYDLDSQVARDGTGSPQFIVTGGSGSGPGGTYIASVPEDVTYTNPAPAAAASDDGAGSAVASALAIASRPDRAEESTLLAASVVEVADSRAARLIPRIGEAEQPASAALLGAAVDNVVDALDLADDLLERLLTDPAP